MNFTSTHRNETCQSSKAEEVSSYLREESSTFLGTYPGESRHNPTAILPGFMEQSHGESSAVLSLL